MQVVQKMSVTISGALLTCQADNVHHVAQLNETSSIQCLLSDSLVASLQQYRETPVTMMQKGLLPPGCQAVIQCTGSNAVTSRYLAGDNFSILGWACRLRCCRNTSLQTHSSACVAKGVLINLGQKA